MDKYSLQDFWDKADWEGGLEGLAGWGLDSKAITDKKLAKMWSDYLKVHKELEKHSDIIHDYLREKGIEGP